MGASALVSDCCFDDGGVHTMSVSEATISNPHDVVTQLESLGYIPDRFDENQTMDNDRSYSRYSQIILRVSAQERVRLPRCSPVGDVITLLSLCPVLLDVPLTNGERYPATCFLDGALTKLTIRPFRHPEAFTIGIPVDSINVICSLRELAFDQKQGMLTEAEMNRAVVMQYLSRNSVSKRVGFLVKSEFIKDHFIQSMTTLWIENHRESQQPPSDLNNKSLRAVSPCGVHPETAAQAEQADRRQRNLPGD